jgi:hypothetical protein
MNRRILFGLVISGFLMPIQAAQDAGSPAVHRFENLWVVTYIDAAGLETIAAARAASGEMAPLMAVDDERLQSIIEAGKMLAAGRHVKLNLVKFSQRSEIGVFSPATP